MQGRRRFGSRLLYNEISFHHAFIIYTSISYEWNMSILEFVLHEPHELHEIIPIICENYDARFIGEYMFNNEQTFCIQLYVDTTFTRCKVSELFQGLSGIKGISCIINPRGKHVRSVGKFKLESYEYSRYNLVPEYIKKPHCRSWEGIFN